MSATEAQASAAEDWREAVFPTLKRFGVTQIAYVPDAGHATVIHAAADDPDTSAIALTTEEEGVALLCGAWLGGVRGALLTQSSGVGNCVNMLSLPRLCRTPILMLVTMRGEWGETNGWQTPMGGAPEAALALMEVRALRAERAEDVGETVAAAAQMVFVGETSAAVLISQRAIGAKTF